MSRRVSVDQMASAVMKQLNEYANLTSDGVKSAVKKAAKTVKTETQAGASSATGAYKKSWATKNTKETAHSLEVTVHSRNRYQLAHLLEYGHAKRGGGRVAARPHIAAAEQSGIQQLEQEIERCIRNG
ncbi:HK97 gp10 family phage protein [Lachnospiraceae bacterium CLA-AA-H246]|uniref:HK97 gp10 family phage protein n=1 Tax=Hominisplanchenecus faecis TaxID=2885351 RepID=A0ABS8ER84_9FIRM|nr:HK97 gp10 family phage protein [Hominisplanchenecus faecis]MCC2147676.1 HK97 gp10 family phage protein [Hominisplanchenecus faecis]